MTFLSRYSYFILCFCISFSVFSQNGKITGNIKFENNQPAANVLIFLQGTQKYDTTDDNGNFVIDNIPFGKYNIETSSLEAQKKISPIEIVAFSLKTNIILKKAAAETLNDVVLDIKSEKTEIETKGFAVNVIDTKEVSLRNVQTNELLDRTVGVRIRQNGGFGSEANYNINGLSGSSIKIFIDGIPISTYGSSFDLNSIPPSIIDRVEVYKGVVPGHLADDALGGAINIVLKKGSKNNFNISTSHGSFNTTQLNVNGLYRFEKSGLTLKLSSFYNYSDNDYEVWGKNVYNIKPNGQYDYVKARRFNDAFRSVGNIIETGFTYVKWADNFFIGFTNSDSYKEVQHGTFMTTPYKGRFLESDANIFHITYNKKNFLLENLDFNFHGVYGERNRTINDTVKYNYNWFGEQSLDLNGQPIPRPSGAQQGAPTLANIKREVASFRTGLNYAISKKHRFLLNHSFSILNREDDDEIRTILERNFLGTRDLTKNVSSLSYEFTALEDKLKATLFGKHYQQKIVRMNPIIENNNGVNTRVEDIVSSNKNAQGYGAAISYLVVPTVTLMTSAEKAVRMPTENEVFGDAGDNISENPNIKHETSKNFNVGFRFGSFQYKKHDLIVSTNGFVRKITDRIGVPVQTALNSNIQTLPFANQGNVQSKGFDVELNYTFSKNLNVIVNTSKFDLTTKDIYERELKLPNEPYFTANGSIQYSLKNLFAKKSQLNLFYNLMFVDTFNYIATPYGNNTGTDFFSVPEQFIQDLGLSYIFPNKDFSLSFDAKNIFNKQAFDNLAVQKPGRAFYLKLNYTINNF